MTEWSAYRLLRVEFPIEDVKNPAGVLDPSCGAGGFLLGSG
jgi:hypothetical protein